MSKLIWQPQPKQAIFMSRPEDEALFGGSAGGGKSDALVIEALRQVHIPHYKALILRKTYPELSELIDKSLLYYTQAYPKAKYNASTHTWTFPSGAKIIFGSMHTAKDKIKYQGRQFDLVAFDELTHFTFEEFDYLRSRCRPSGPGTRTYVRATANPGNIGHAWVKERFISAAPAMQTITENVEWVDKAGQKNSRKISRIFVPSSLWDNRKLMENDPNYVVRLASMAEAEKKALLYGDWDSFSGQVFTSWRNDSSHYKDRQWTHVIDPFRIPPDWAIWCGLDWGYSRPFSIMWWAVDHERRMYGIREYYGCTGTPNEGVRMEPSAVARVVHQIESEDPNLSGRRINRVGDPAIWGTQGTESIGTLLERERLYFEKGINHRINGLMQLQHRFAFDDNGIPLLYVFNTCKHFIRTIPALVYDEKNVEDVDTEGEDHIFDQTKYVAMRYPVAPPVRKAEVAKIYNPFDIDDDKTLEKYNFYMRY